MQKQDLFILKIIQYVFTLTIICVICGFVLSWVYKTTIPQIELYQKKKIDLARRELLPQAIEFRDEQNWVSGYNEKSELVGRIVSSEARGYGGKIKILIGLDIQNKITGIKIIQQSETPGLGDQIKKKDFIQQFVGKDKSEIAEVHAVTGATISSKAVIEAVKRGIEKLEQEREY